MHKDYRRAMDWVPTIIGAAIEVHRLKGPGLIESIYEKCMMREIDLRQVPARTQFNVDIEYKGFVFDESLKLDVYVDGCLIVELKAVKELLPIHEAQLLSYMKLLDAPVGLLMNFHEMRLKDGIRRLTLKGADTTEDGKEESEQGDRGGRGVGGEQEKDF